MVPPSRCSFVSRVLVVDRRGRADRVVQALERLGAVAEAAEDLAEAAVLLRDGHWDALLVELHLDAGNAIDLLRLLGARQSLPPVILMGDDITQEDLTRALRLKVADFLPRPCEPFALAAALERTTADADPIALTADDLTRLLRGAIADLAGLQSGYLDPSAVLDRVAASPRLLAAAQTAEGRWDDVRLDPRVPADGMTLEAAGARVLGAALLATAWSLDGPWHRAASERAEACVRLGHRCRSAARDFGLDPATSELAVLLRGVAPLALMVSAANAPNLTPVEPALLQRIESQAPVVARTLLPRWGMPPALAARTGLYAPPDAQTPSSIDSLIAWALAEGAVGPALAPTDLPDLLQCAVNHQRAHRVLPIPRRFDGDVRLVSGRIQVVATLRQVFSRSASLTLHVADREIVHELIDRARLDGVWLEVKGPGGRVSAQVPVDLPRVRMAPPYSATVRLVGAPHHEERLRTVVLHLMNRRGSVRLPADPKDPVAVRISSGESALDGVLLDLSVGGVGLLTRAGELVPPPGQPVTLDLHLPDDGPAVPVSGTVTHIRELAGTDPVAGVDFAACAFGVRLDPASLGGAVRRRWNAYVMARQRAVLRRHGRPR